MRVSIVTGHHVPSDARAYAEAKLRRLEHYANLGEVNLTVERETDLFPEASAEIVLHVRRTRLSARQEAASVREAIDGVIDKADEQVRRHHDRVTDRKGRIRADAAPPRPCAAWPRAAPFLGQPGGPPSPGWTAPSRVRTPCLEEGWAGRLAGTIQLGTEPPGPLGAVTGAPAASSWKLAFKLGTLRFPLGSKSHVPAQQGAR